MEKAEQETTMTWDSEQKVVRIFSARVADQGKLKRKGILPVKGSQVHGFFYEMPLSRLRWTVKALPDGQPRKVRVASPAFLQARKARNGNQR